MLQLPRTALPVGPAGPYSCAQPDPGQEEWWERSGLTNWLWSEMTVLHVPRSIDSGEVTSLHKQVTFPQATQLVRI